MTTMDTVWLDVGAVDDIPAQSSRIVKTQNGCIALFRTADDKVFALNDRCPHKGGPLSQGIVHGNSVTCPLHNMVFSLENGDALGPDEGRVETFAVKVENGRIKLDASSFASRKDAA